MNTYCQQKYIKDENISNILRNFNNTACTMMKIIYRLMKFGLNDEQIEEEVVELIQEFKDAFS